MILRPLSPADDLSALTALLHRAYARLGGAGFNYTAVDQSEAVTRERIDLAECLVADDAGQVVGTITLRPPGASEGCRWYERPEVAVFGQFGVDPAYQVRGVGTALLRAVELRAGALGARELALDTAEDATLLVDWYARKGYRWVEQVQWAGKTYRSVILSKAL